MFVNEKESPIFSRSVSGLKVRIINTEGKEMVVDVTPDLKVEQVKVMCLGQFCSESSKQTGSYDLLRVSTGRPLNVESSIGQCVLRPNEELLLIKRTASSADSDDLVSSFSKETESLSGPSSDDITQATAEMGNKNEERAVPAPANEASFSRELQPILISLIEAAQRVLCLSKDAAEIFTRVQEQLAEDGSRYPDPSSVLVVQLMDMGFSRHHAEKALRLHSNLITDAMEWLLAHQDDPVLEEPLPDDGLSSGEVQLVNTESTGTLLETLPPKRVLELFRAYHRRSFRPNELVKLKLMEMGFDEMAVIDALRLSGNDQSQAQLNERFPEDKPVFHLQQLLPAHTKADALEKVMEAAEVYAADLDSPIPVVKAQVNVWLSILRKERRLDGGDGLQQCIQRADAETLPAVSTLLRLFGTIPVTTATAERSFSSLRRLKTYLRSTMEEERLTGLALLSAHRDVTIDTEVIVDMFKNAKHRRLAL